MQQSDHIIFHIDVNSAYLSWSALKALQEGAETDLREIPSIVGGDQTKRQGVVVAKSIPAKKYGIKTADTVASAFQKCPNLVSVKPDFSYYSDRSHELMHLLEDICPVIEQVSIDECYMDYEPIRSQFKDPLEAAYFIKDKVKNTLGFTVNVGISDRKILAKMASDFQKPDKVHTLYVREIRKKMWPLPIGDLHMCGKSSQTKLKTMGIHTIGDLALCDRTMVESWLKSAGVQLWNYANGIDDSVVNPNPSKAKGIGNSITLSSDAVTTGEAYKVLKNLCDSVSKRLQRYGFIAAQISVEIKYNTFISVSHQTTVNVPTSDAEDLYKNSCRLFDELWNHEPIRLLGVRTTKLSDVSEPVQMDLFSFAEHKETYAKKDKLETAMRSIRERYGENAIRKGLQQKQE